ncbi:MAG TPA: cytochrome P450 [Ilumatobacteraceae bacterium]|jgi:cytochrome P450
MTSTSEHPDAEQIVQFDHHSPDFAKDPWPELARHRAECPVAYSETYGGFWVVTKYDDIKKVAHDDETFSSAQTVVIPPKKNVHQKSIPIEMDAPESLEYRKILQPLFAPPAVERITPLIEYYANACIDNFIESGEVDVVHDFADPLPVMVTLQKLGLPTDDWRLFAEPMHKVVFLRQDNPARANILQELGWIADQITEAIRQRRESPRDDMITYLLQSRPFGEPVTDHAVHEMVMLTMQGGFDTTGSAISGALIHLDRDRDARKRLIDEPDLMRTAVEEFLRFEAPQFALARTATRDVEVGGCPVREGERLLLVWASGNRDEDVFERADEVVLDRFPNKHMSFGLGAHRCLGSTLARRQIQVALRTILRRIPDYEIDHDRLVRAETIGVTHGTFAMPIRFTPGRRVLS